MATVASKSGTNQVNVAILGASGYTGGELVRILAHHPNVAIRALTAERHAGQPMAKVFPHLAHVALPPLVKIDDVKLDDIDAAFLALPHGLTQDVALRLPKHLKIVDLSADFRLADVDVYANWYGHEHRAPEMQKHAVYGLTELKRDEVKTATLVANPGCYPTSAQLPLAPLLAAKQIDADNIIIDAKSGVTGAGREAKEANLFAEVAEGLHAYGVANHRHAPEIEQGLTEAAGKPVLVNFTPHLMPMSRGILSTIYVRLANGTTPDDLRATLARRYAAEPFVKVLPAGSSPATRHVRGTNYCHIAVFPDRLPGRAIVISVIDNLVKGASGQAIQNFNVVFGLPETTSLEQEALFP
ncbi:MAG: N-acetyl-gamma-glutamyl-phosphate reductase [Gemmatimonas sp.]